MSAAARVALWGEDFWRRRFAADPKIVGETVRLDGQELPGNDIALISVAAPAPEPAHILSFAAAVLLTGRRSRTRKVCR